MHVKGHLIEIEGIDKTGKNLLQEYIVKLSNYKYIVHPRGILSALVYSNKYQRNYDYEFDYKPIIVYLDVDEPDRQIRCEINNEPAISALMDRILFEQSLEQLQQEGYTILKYNTSVMTPYAIAKDVISKIENKNDMKGN